MTTDISVGVRWDPLAQQQEGGQGQGNGQGGGQNNEEYEFDYDGGNSSSRLFERSRIKALAGKSLSLSSPAAPALIRVDSCLARAR